MNSEKNIAVINGGRVYVSLTMNHSVVYVVL